MKCWFNLMLPNHWKYMEKSYQLQNEQKDELSPISISHSVFTRILLQGTFPGVNIWLLLGVRTWAHPCSPDNCSAYLCEATVPHVLGWNGAGEGQEQGGQPELPLLSMGLAYLCSQQVMAQNSRTALQTLTQSCACMEDTSSSLSLCSRGQ